MHQHITITPEMTKTPEQIKDMARKLIQGDKDMINPLIEAHIELAYKIAGKYIGKTIDKSPDKKDSIIAQALFELTRTVNRAASGSLYDENITKYIASSISGCLHRFIIMDRLIPIEPSAFRELAEKDRIMEFLPIILLLREDQDQDQEEEEDNQSYCLSTMDSSCLTDFDRECLDVIKIIDWREDDKIIIAKLMEGYTYEEIGNQLSKNKQYVMYRLRVIHRKVMERV